MIVMGSSFYRAGGGEGERQARAMEALAALPGVHPVNLQFVDERYSPPGLDTRPVLRLDSRQVTRAPGRRKPIVREMFDALAAIAAAEKSPYFAFFNSDIEVTGGALAPLDPGQLDGVAYSRMDVDPSTGNPLTVQRYGLDMFAVRTSWWSSHRHRFRPYIAGEQCWDNVYASLVCWHGDGRIIDEHPGIYHRLHESHGGSGAFAEYNGYLAALDSPYFSRWVEYVTSLDQAIRSGQPVDRIDLSRRIFRRRLSAADRVRHAGRQVRARVRYAVRRRGA